MPNPHRGDVEFVPGYILNYSIDAICVLEEATGKTLLELSGELRNIKTVKMSLVRQIIHAGLIEKHPTITLKEAGELILAAGGSIPALVKVSEALAAGLPGSAPGAPPSPRRRRPHAN